MLMNCSIIGSFRKHYREAGDAMDTFECAGIKVLSPPRSTIENPEEEFVFFKSDASRTPEHVQLIALHRILRSDFVYLVAPNGYVGRTTCYEIGRVQHARIPLYLSEEPRDLPIVFSDDSIMPPEAIGAYWQRHGRLPPAAGAHPDARTRQLSAALDQGRFLDV